MNNTVQFPVHEMDGVATAMKAVGDLTTRTRIAALAHDVEMLAWMNMPRAARGRRIRELTTQIEALRASLDP